MRFPLPHVAAWPLHDGTIPLPVRCNNLCGGRAGEFDGVWRGLPERITYQLDHRPIRLQVETRFRASSATKRKW